MSLSKSRLRRRSFLAASSMAASGLAGLGVWSSAAPRVRAQSPNEKLKIACIGVGGQGAGNVTAAAREQLVALCDVDEQRAAVTYGRFSKVRRFTDYRRMYDEIGDSIDAVVISTPDHTHFHATHGALIRGKHVYLEKPMAHDVWQARRLTDLARDKGVATQLGVQRHAIPNMARVVELVRSGVLGPIAEVHSWIGSKRGMPDDLEHPTKPAGLDFDLWLGPAPHREYSPGLAPYNWRFWWDYGTGEAGNWGCHVLDIPFWALDLKYPTQVEVASGEPHPEKTPVAMTVTFTFPAPERDPVRLHWSQSDGPPAGVRELVAKHKINMSGINTLFIGRDGVLACGFDKRRLYPEEKFADFKEPAPSIPASPGFHDEWFAACRGGAPASCHWGYSGPLSETVLLANAAFRAGGPAFSWDAPTLTATGNPALAPFLREEVRKGWEIA